MIQIKKFYTILAISLIQLQNIFLQSNNIFVIKSTEKDSNSKNIEKYYYDFITIDGVDYAQLYVGGDEKKITKEKRKIFKFMRKWTFTSYKNRISSPTANEMEMFEENLQKVTGENIDLQLMKVLLGIDSENIQINKQYAEKRFFTLKNFNLKSKSSKVDDYENIIKGDDNMQTRVYKIGYANNVDLGFWDKREGEPVTKRKSSIVVCLTITEDLSDKPKKAGEFMITVKFLETDNIDASLIESQEWASVLEKIAVKGEIESEISEETEFSEFFKNLDFVSKETPTDNNTTNPDVPKDNTDKEDKEKKKGMSKVTILLIGGGIIGGMILIGLIIYFIAIMCGNKSNIYEEKV